MPENHDPASERERRLLHAAKLAKTACDTIRGLGMFPKFTALHTACDALNGAVGAYEPAKAAKAVRL